VRTLQRRTEYQTLRCSENVARDAVDPEVTMYREM